MSPFQELLGYQGGCLSAPAEVSTWTKFCEVDLPEAVNKFLCQKEFTKLPEQFVRFEYHMGQPIRMHNIRKRMHKDKKNLEAASVLPDGRQVNTVGYSAVPNNRVGWTDIEIFGHFFQFYPDAF